MCPHLDISLPSKWSAEMNPIWILGWKAAVKKLEHWGRAIMTLFTSQLTPTSVPLNVKWSVCNPDSSFCKLSWSFRNKPLFTFCFYSRQLSTNCCFGNFGCKQHSLQEALSDQSCTLDKLQWHLPYQKVVKWVLKGHLENKLQVCLWRIICSGGSNSHMLLPSEL